MAIDLQEDTVWTPEVGDVATIHSAYGAVRMGILWNYTGNTVQYFRQHNWERLLSDLKDPGSEPSYPSYFMAKREHYWNDKTWTVWQKKMAPLAMSKIAPEPRKLAKEIQSELSPTENLID